MKTDQQALLAAAVEVTGDPAKAERLLAAPMPSFGGKTLRDVAAEGRLQAALDYIESIASGFVG